jgi:beta-galactosidase
MTRHLACAVALAGLVLAPARPALFPVAVWYGGGKARAPMVSSIGPGSEREWRDDLQKIRALGFNTVRTGVEGSAGEPREGQYRFEHLDLMLRLAGEVGLGVIVQVYVDSAPEWVDRKFPDGRFVAQDGTAIRSQSAPGSCFDHPGVRDAVLRFFREVARRASASAALRAYDVWSEPAVMNWALPTYVPNAQFCYCPHSVARFRDYLKLKYGTLEQVNRAWYRTFGDWSEVEPPRFGTILTYADFMDWRIYIGEKIAADLKARARAVKEVDPGHLVTSHAPNPSPVFRTLADGMDASDDYLMKERISHQPPKLPPTATSRSNAAPSSWTWCAPSRATPASSWASSRPGTASMGSSRAIRSRLPISSCTPGAWYRGARGR